jgi:hypothetical protein
MENIEDNKQTLEERYERLYKFTRGVLLATHLPQDFENNYEIRLAKETIKNIQNKKIQRTSVLMVVRRMLENGILRRQCVTKMEFLI